MATPYFHKGLPPNLCEDKNIEEAVLFYEQTLKTKGDQQDVEVIIKLAEALTTLIRRRTDGCGLVIKDLHESDEGKAICTKYGPRAHELSIIAAKERPNDAAVAMLVAEAYFYANAPKGIVAQALGGAAWTFKGNFEKVLAIDKGHDSGAAYCYIGGYFALAPWPIGNLKVAKDYMQQALAVASCNRNHYNAAVIAWRSKDYAHAAENFRTALKSPALSPQQQDLLQFYQTESKKALLRLETLATGKVNKLPSSKSLKSRISMKMKSKSFRLG